MSIPFPPLLFTLIASTPLVSIEAPPGFTAVRHTPSCTFYLGNTEEDGVIPARTECHFNHLTVEHFTRTFSNWKGHPSMWSSVGRVDVIEETKRQGLYREIHVLPGVTDREVLIRWQLSDLQGGGVRFALHHDKTAAPSDPRYVQCQRYDGLWEAKYRNDGLFLVTENRYHPGDIPSWLVRFFLINTMEKTMDELLNSMTASALVP